MQPTKVSIRNLAAAVIGNALEWYDFLVFAFMTPIIARLFFPVDPSAKSGDLNDILMTTAIFGVGFFMRPVGGVILGMYGDKHGRKAAMVLVTSLMAVSMAIITFSPTYLTAGILAPILILIARLVQGFSAGGEFGTATALLIEMAPPGKRGYYGSWQMTGQMIGLLIGAAAGTLMTVYFTQEEIEAWAWRIPFFVGLVIIPIAVYIRRRLDETEVFQNAKRQEQAEGRRISIGELLISAWRETVMGIGLVAAATVTVYITFTYLVTFATKILKLPLQETFEVQMLGALWVVILTPLMGMLSDRIGRSRLLIGSLALYFVILFPIYSWLTAAPSISRLVVVQLATGLCAAGFFAVFSTVMAVLFPTRVRSLGLSISYNLAVMLIGGFAQFIVTWLIQQTGSPMAPTYYVMFGVGLGLIAALLLGKRADAEIVH